MPTRKRYYYCIVPMCKNTSVTTPEKHFISVPRNSEVRKKWCAAMNRCDQKNPELSPTTIKYCCEDHFDLKEDMENYVKHKLMGLGKLSLKAKEGVLPHIFKCQQKCEAIESSTGVSSSGVKRRRTKPNDRSLNLEIQPSTSNAAAPLHHDSTNMDMLFDQSIRVDIASKCPITETSYKPVQGYNTETRKVFQKSQKVTPVIENHLDSGHLSDELTQINSELRKKITEIGRQVKLKGNLDRISLALVMNQIKNTLESMSKEELVSFARVKIEEEIKGRTDSIEKDKKIQQLQISNRSLQTSVKTLQTKNEQLKNSMGALFKKPKKKKTSISKKQLSHQGVTEPELLPVKTEPLVSESFIVPLQLSKTNNFILPDFPPEESPEFITSDFKIEYPEIQIVDHPVGDQAKYAQIKQEIMPYLPENLAQNGFNQTQDLPVTSEQNQKVPPSDTPVAAKTEPAAMS